MGARIQRLHSHNSQISTLGEKLQQVGNSDVEWSSNKLDHRLRESKHIISEYTLDLYLGARCVSLITGMKSEHASKGLTGIIAHAERHLNVWAAATLASMSTAHHWLIVVS